MKTFETTGIWIASAILLGALFIGQAIKQPVQTEVRQEVEAITARTQTEYMNDAMINMHGLGHEFVGIPTEFVHTMRVYEDGSYNIEYQDGTSERGCLTTGLCQD